MRGRSIAAIEARDRNRQVRREDGPVEVMFWKQGGKRREALEQHQRDLFPSPQFRSVHMSLWVTLRLG